jgi:hypothetical protein
MRVRGPDLRADHFRETAKEGVDYTGEPAQKVSREERRGTRRGMRKTGLRNGIAIDFSLKASS